jgi:hypothetical protein
MGRIITKLVRAQVNSFEKLRNENTLKYTIGLTVEDLEHLSEFLTDSA